MMMADRQDQRLAAVLRTGWPEPRPGWEGRALSAMAGVRPRRHPNLVTIIVVTLILLLLAAVTFAAVRFLVQGRLQFLEVDPWAPPDARREAVRLLSGELEWADEHPEGTNMSEFDVSPSGDRICFYRADGWIPTRADILTANSDRSDETNLTATLGGINCWPKWSPDGTMIAFIHTERRPDQMACEAGFHAWVMNADGSGARPIIPESEEPTWFCTWLPDGAHVLLYQGPVGPKSGTDRDTDVQRWNIITDLWGRNPRPLPNVYSAAAYSPDGTKIVSTTGKRTVCEGRPGWCNQLLLTNADGSDPRVLVEQFISDADVLHALEGDRAKTTAAALPRFDMAGGILGFVGPSKPAWSPKGDQIAFLAAMPFDPKGPDVQKQVEVYVYDLANREVIRITHDDLRQRSVVWK
jgi:hypothetical protein